MRCFSLTYNVMRQDGMQTPSVFMQATVGAGLPVIATLKHLIDTGDKIVKVLCPHPLNASTGFCSWHVRSHRRTAHLST